MDSVIVIEKDSKAKYRRELREALIDVLINTFGLTKESVRATFDEFFDKVIDARYTTRIQEFIDLELQHNRGYNEVKMAFFEAGLKATMETLNKEVEALKPGFRDRLQEAFGFHPQPLTESQQLNTPDLEIFNTFDELISDNAIHGFHRKAALATEGSNLYLKYAGCSKWTPMNFNVYNRGNLITDLNLNIPSGSSVLIREEDGSFTNCIAAPPAK